MTDFLKLETNIPVVVEVPTSSYENPRTTKKDGSSMIDQWNKQRYMYNFKVGDKYMNLYATEKQHEAIQAFGFSKGMKMQLTQKEEGKSKKLEVLTENGEPFASNDSQNDPGGTGSSSVDKVVKKNQTSLSDDSMSKSDWQQKELRVIRTAISKSLIERGVTVDKKNAKGVYQEAMWWFAFITAPQKLADKYKDDKIENDILNDALKELK